jgi:hypothetical protein
LLLTETLIDDLHQFRIAMMKRFIVSLKQVRPHADFKDVGSGVATYPGNGANLTQVYGISHRNAAFDLEEVDAFFEGKSDNWELIVTPFESTTLMTQAIKIGYAPDHFESVLAMIAGMNAPQVPLGVDVEEVTGDLTQWARVSDAGWCGTNDLADELSPIGQFALAAPTRRFMAYVDGEPAATASLIEIDGKFLFAGASTLPKFRNRGLQTALTQRRLAEAGSGSIVQVVAMPGSQSHRNLQRIGFRPLYSKLVMFRHG